MKRHQEAEPELPLRNKRIHTGGQDAPAPGPSSTDTKTADKPKGFFNLAQELRDSVYDLLRQDIPYAQRGRRDEADLASNSWHIGYINGPSLPALVLGPDVSAEYLAHVAESMYAVVKVSMREDSKLGGAPWYESLPVWVRENVRGVRMVLYLGHYERMATETYPQDFSVEDMYQCVQNTVNAAAESLPSLQSLEVMIHYACYYQYSTLINDVKHQGLDVRRLLSAKPTATDIERCSIGFLIDTPLRVSPNEDTTYGRLVLDTLLQENPNYDLDDECGRWYATLSDSKSTYQFLGMEWYFVAPLTPLDEGDDGEFTEDPTSEDGLSDVSSIANGSDDESTVEAEEADEMRNALTKRLFLDFGARCIPRQEGIVLGYYESGAIWVHVCDQDLATHEPSAADWRAARDAGVDMDSAMRALVEHGKSTKTVRQFQAAMV
ncbi:hypothetical protein LTR85_009498 [Meristemomyces frigidus]|nr:hypothetical protein LTR85_009498 [Meristemomyces frigidus]